MSNPKVRPHLSFYPEDSGPKLYEARQGQRWLHELPDNQTTPMVRISGSDYFTYEPAMLRDGTCCIPTRWFLRGGVVYAKCWKLVPISTDVRTGWRAIKSTGYEVTQDQFLKNFVTLRQDAQSLYGLPDPACILGQYIPYRRCFLVR